MAAQCWRVHISTEAIFFVPLTFGFGPAAIATAVARQLHVRRPEIAIIGVGDGIAFDFMRASRTFETLMKSPPGTLPDCLGNDSKGVVVSFADFERIGVAAFKGLSTVVVDPLYWMWDTDPIDPATVSLYLALAFPGVAERVEARRTVAGDIHIVPPVVALGLPMARNKRAGTIVNLGGAVSPIGNNYAYLRALVEVIGETLGGAEDLLVACSSVAAKAINSPGPIAGVVVEELAFDEMTAMLGRCARLLTVPGQSIMWEALQMQTPTLLLPGSNYSQHRQVSAFRRFFADVAFITWDDLEGYQTLPPGLPENLGVARAVELGNRMANDQTARRQLGRLLADALSSVPLAAPKLRAGHPWSNFDGAARVVDEILALHRSL